MKRELFVCIVQCLFIMSFSNTDRFGRGTFLPKIKVQTNQNSDSKAYSLGCVTWNLAERSPLEKDMAFLESMRYNDFIAVGVQVG